MNIILPTFRVEYYMAILNNFSFFKSLVESFIFVPYLEIDIAILLNNFSSFKNLVK